MRKVPRRKLLRDAGLAGTGVVGTSLSGCLGDGGDRDANDETQEEADDGSGSGDGDRDGSDGNDGNDGTGTDSEGEEDDVNDEDEEEDESTEETEGVLRIGVLQPLSGIVGYLGETSVEGFISGLAHRHGVDPFDFVARDGETVEFEAEDGTYRLLLRDTDFNAGRAQAAATELVTGEDVDMLFGCVSSDATERVIQQVAKPTDTPYVVGASSGIATVGDPRLCGRKIFRANEHVGMEARAEGRYVAEETDTETVYLMGPDDEFGRSSTKAYRSVLKDTDVEVVGESLVPRGFSAFGDLLGNIADTSQGLIINFTADTLPNFMSVFVDGNASGDFDLRGYGALPGRTGMNLIGNVLEAQFGEITEESVREANLGALASRYHWNQYDNPVNDEFVSSYTEAYGRLPDIFTSGSFTAGYAVAQAVDESGALDSDGVADSMRDMTVEETPKGEEAYTFQEHNNQAKSPMTVSRLVPNNEGRDVWEAPVMPGEPLVTIGADEAVMPVSEPRCDLREDL